jgi:hypothetical protein
MEGLLRQASKSVCLSIGSSTKSDGFPHRVEEDLEDEQSDPLNDYMAFVKYVREEAIKSERYFPIEPKI